MLIVSLILGLALSPGANAEEKFPSASAIAVVIYDADFDHVLTPKTRTKSVQ